MGIQAEYRNTRLGNAKIAHEGIVHQPRFGFDQLRIEQGRDVFQGDMSGAHAHP